MTSNQNPGGESGGILTPVRHGLLLFGQDPVYLSLLTASPGPPGFQVLLEAQLDGPASGALRADRGHGDGSYTLDPGPFPFADLEPRDGAPALKALEGTLVRGFAGQGGIPVATGVRADIRNVVWFGPVGAGAAPGPGQALEYLCFGRGDQVYLVHRVQAWPSFDQVLTVRLVPGTVRTLVGHPLGDDVAAIRFGQAQRADTGRDDTAERRLAAGEVATVAFPLTRSPSFSRGFTVQLEVERELYLEVNKTNST